MSTYLSGTTQVRALNPCQQLPIRPLRSYTIVAVGERRRRGVPENTRGSAASFSVSLWTTSGTSISQSSILRSASLSLLADNATGRCTILWQRSTVESTRLLVFSVKEVLFCFNGYSESSEPYLDVLEFSICVIRLSSGLIRIFRLRLVRSYRVYDCLKFLTFYQF